MWQVSALKSDPNLLPYWVTPSDWAISRFSPLVSFSHICQHNFFQTYDRDLIFCMLLALAMLIKMIYELLIYPIFLESYIKQYYPYPINKLISCQKIAIFSPGNDVIPQNTLYIYCLHVIQYE